MRGEPRSCVGCGAQTGNAKYCSNRCQQDHRWHHTKAEIDRTGVVPIGPSGNPNVAKRFLLCEQGRCCAICGLTEWRGQPVPLVLDHINGDATDWRVSNLRLICGNCDMQLPTFKSRKPGTRQGVATPAVCRWPELLMSHFDCVVN
jgi:hypothetical protein